MSKTANKRGAKSAPEPTTRCGYVALIGAPNAGKSTLLNQLVGRKLAIVTPKVQTTRTRLLGIAIIGPAQLILIDTPGIFEPRRRLDRWPSPEDQPSDAPERWIAAEVTREQVFLQLHDELPYAATVETESWEERRDGSVRIDQVLYVQRPRQRAIVLGDKGQRIKTIGARARAELEQMLERRIHLFLFVKVRENWIEDPERYAALGLDYNA